MDRIEILKKAKEKVDALVAEQNREVETESDDTEATKMAIEMQKHDALISAIEQNYTSPEEMARVFSDAISQITVNVPEMTIPEIKIPQITVPEAKVTVNIPEIKLPTVNVPEPKVTVNVPEVKIPPFPEIKMPESMEVHGEVGLFGYGFNNPLPVQLRDAEGNPVSLPDMMSVASGGGGPRFVKINNTSSEPIPITGNISSTPGATYYASDAIGSVNIVQSIPIDVTVIGATGTIGVVTINPDGNPVYGGTSSGGGLTDAELRASSIDVQQASGASWSTSVLSMPAVVVTSITNSTASALVDSTGAQYSGSNPVPVTTVPSISNGLTKFHLVGAGTTNETNIKSSPGQVYAISAFNIGASPVYLKFHNTAGTPTAGTGVTDTFLIPGNTSGAGALINIDKGITFSTGIGISLVTGLTDASAVAITADNVVVNIYYK